MNINENLKTFLKTHKENDFSPKPLLNHIVASFFLSSVIQFEKSFHSVVQY